MITFWREESVNEGMWKAHKEGLQLLVFVRRCKMCNNAHRYCDLIRAIIHKQYCMHNGSICSLKTSIQYIENNFIPYLCDCVLCCIEDIWFVKAVRLYDCVLYIIKDIWFLKGVRHVTWSAENLYIAIVMWYLDFLCL